MAGEKDEKNEEKEMQKTEEKSAEEKSWDEKWRRDPLYAATWAFIFIWAGIVLILNNMGLLTRFIPRETVDPWNVILVGAGVIVLFKALAHLLVPSYRRPMFGTFILSVILVGLGLGGIFGWAVIGPVFLIGLGLAILLRGFTRRR